MSERRTIREAARTTPELFRSDSVVSATDVVRVDAAVGLEEGDIDNAAPVVVSDSGNWLTTDEDTPLTFDIADLLANDSDPDGDAIFLAGWDMELPGGTLEQISDTQMRFTPVEEYSGTQNFSYTVSDGIDTASGIATLVITSVNDDEVAFDDAAAFSGDPTYPGQSHYGPSVLANDFDMDGDTLTAELVSGPSVGSVTLAPDGTYVWVTPFSVPTSAQTSFTYVASDGIGDDSEPATVTLLLRGPASRIAPPPGPDGVAVDDLYFTGNEAVSGNVLSNDTDVYLAVVDTQPAVGRLTSFEYTGVFTYLPSVGDVDAAFTYRVFSSAGLSAIVAAVQLPAVNLEIFHGQAAAQPVRAADEVNVGAFTVVNRNDTDGDGLRDVEAADVQVSPAGGAGTQQPVGVTEVDLMKLRVHRPNVPFPFAGDIRIDFTAAKAKIFSAPDKTGAVASQQGGPLGEFFLINAGVFQQPGQPLAHKDYWIEVQHPDDNLRYVTVTMSHAGATDTVKATGVWATNTGFRTAGNTLSGLNDQPQMQATWSSPRIVDSL